MSYFPVLRNSTAEMNAYGSLNERTKAEIIPIIESKRVSLAKRDNWWSSFNTLGSYLSGKFGPYTFIYDYKQAFDKLGEIDEHMIDESGKNLISHCSFKMDTAELNYIPCVHFDSPEWYIDSVIALNKETIAIRVRCHDFSDTLDSIILQAVQNNIIEKCSDLSPSVYLILDFYNVPTSKDRIEKAINTFSKIDDSKIVLSLSTCPEDASNAGPMTFDVASSRNDLSLFKELQRKYPRIFFSDYTVRVNPEPEREARIDYYNTYIKIFYTSVDSYMIGKSSLIKDQGIEKFHDICQEIVDSDVYSGRDFSAGDRAVYDCAKSNLKISDHSKPIEYGVNHHIELTAYQFRQN